MPLAPAVPVPAVRAPIPAARIEPTATSATRPAPSVTPAPALPAPTPARIAPNATSPTRHTPAALPAAPTPIAPVPVDLPRTHAAHVADEDCPFPRSRPSSQPPRSYIRVVVRDNESDDEAGDEAPDDDSSAEDFGSFSIYVCLLKVLGESEQRSKLVTQNVGEYRGEVWFANLSPDFENRMDCADGWQYITVQQALGLMQRAPEKLVLDRPGTGTRTPDAKRRKT